MTLYLCSRDISRFGAGLVLLVVISSWAGSTDRHGSIGVIVMMPLLAVVVLTLTLDAADEELERSTARPWPKIRLVHLVTGTLVCVGALALAGLVGSAETVLGLVRNTMAGAGIVACSAVLLGARLAWLPAFFYLTAMALVLLSPPDPETWWWSWPAQPTELRRSWWAAGAWFAAGAALYAAFGAKVKRDDDT